MVTSCCRLVCVSPSVTAELSSPYHQLPVQCCAVLRCAALCCAVPSHYRNAQVIAQVRYPATCHHHALSQRASCVRGLQGASDCTCRFSLPAASSNTSAPCATSHLEVCCPTLGCAMLYHAVLGWAVLCCAVLGYAVLCWQSRQFRQHSCVPAAVSPVTVLCV